jgi:hypothetical protein
MILRDIDTVQEGCAARAGDELGPLANDRRTAGASGFVSDGIVEVSCLACAAVGPVTSTAVRGQVFWARRQVKFWVGALALAITASIGQLF